MSLKRSIEVPAKASVEDIMLSSIPKKSRDIYATSCESFLEFKGDNGVPSESDYLQYFHHLHESNKFKASSM